MLGMGEGGEEGGQVGKDKKEGIEDGKGCHGKGCHGRGVGTGSKDLGLLRREDFLITLIRDDQSRE